MHWENIAKLIPSVKQVFFFLAEVVDLLLRSSEIEGSLRNLKALTVVQVSPLLLRRERTVELKKLEHNSVEGI